MGARRHGAADCPKILRSFCASRPPAPESVVAGLSGGNQQKVVLGKWLAADCRVLIVDEPTRGVDVGAKSEIHGLIDTLAKSGNGVLLISSELPGGDQPLDLYFGASQR